ITSVKEPKLNDIYLDKLITLFNSKNVEPIIIFTKIDLDPSGESNALIDEYSELGFKVFKSSMDNPVTLKELEPIIANSFVVITGQTGAGKSTLLNLLNPSLNLKTAEISKALGRGKHTTRHSEAHKFFGDTYIVDTPGFSSLEIELEPLVIAQNFLNFSKYIGKCRFNDCIHLDEAGCAMKLTPPSDRRIESYKHLLNGVK
ncbi:MAG: ribosome small subunit-dependent GTPase A, partial [Tenericutes bacterium]